jgi:tRNA/rRNA methyltransferase
MEKSGKVEQGGGGGLTESGVEETAQGADSTLNKVAPEALLGRIRIILCQPRHPGNIGAVARAMKTMGLSRLSLVRPERMVRGIADAEAEARASGAGDILAAAQFCESLDEALVGVSHAAAVTARRREIDPDIATARRAAKLLVAGARLADVALVFGNETAGLSNDEVLRCDLRVTIPANPDFSSLNLGAATQVLAYELRQEAFLGFGDEGDDVAMRTGISLPARVAADLAPRELVEGFYEHLQRTMTTTGFFVHPQSTRLMPKLRRLFARTGLEREEINILRGFLSSVDSLERGKLPRKS